MLLVIDVGNSHTVYGVFDGARLCGEHREPTDRMRDAATQAQLLQAALRLILSEPPHETSARHVTDAVVGSVVPSQTDVLAHAIREVCGCEPLVVTGAVPTGLTLRYDNPLELGADRLANAVGGYARSPGGALVVDLGTATKCEVVTPAGEHLGGVIGVGFHIGAEALFQRAARLPRIELVEPPAVIGRNTVHAMQAGLFYGYAGLVQGLVQRLLRSLDFAPRVIATGGWAPTFAPLIEQIHEVEPTLTLDGLRRIHARQGASLGTTTSGSR
jgi:type III pantothenate kinase